MNLPHNVLIHRLSFLRFDLCFILPVLYMALHLAELDLLILLHLYQLVLAFLDAFQVTDLLLTGL